MNSAKKRNLFNEIREGLEALRDRRDALPRHKLPMPDLSPTREHPVSGKSANKIRRRRRRGQTR